jgi:biotin carboxyl carrier protein
VTLDGRERRASVAPMGGRWSLLLGPAEAGHDAGDPGLAEAGHDGASGSANGVSGFSRTKVGAVSVSDEVTPGSGGVLSGFSRTVSGPRDAAPGVERPARSYEVSIEPFDRGEYLVHVNGHAVPVAIIDPRTAFTRGGQQSRATGSAGPKPVVAPMPGRIVKVLVTPGETVAARQGLVVIEAMKMENELRAPAAGTVVEVRVSAGMSVDAHAILLVLE